MTNNIKSKNNNFIEKKEKEDYIRVASRRGVLYGGNQRLFTDFKIHGYGCGLIAAADVALYLNNDRFLRSWEEYKEFIESIQSKFLFFPFFGMTGIALSIGINRVFHQLKLPYRAFWRFLPVGARCEDKIRFMLCQDIPVILAIGPNFPNVFGHKRLSLYRRTSYGTYCKVSSVNKHFVVVTDFGDDGMMKISSWGKCYYISWDELMDYAKKSSMPLFTNFLEIREK